MYYYINLAPKNYKKLSTHIKINYVKQFLHTKSKTFTTKQEDIKQRLCQEFITHSSDK
jgi:hypothetical protein